MAIQLHQTTSGCQGAAGLEIIVVSHAAAKQFWNCKLY